jgi:hypothetical protein
MLAVSIRPSRAMLRRASGVGGIVARARDWNHLTPAETTAKTFMYSVFNLFTGCALPMSGRGAYLHASSFERNGHGVALVASGGVGKTTSVLKLVAEDRWNYLSDDLAVVDSTGMLWRSPLRMQVYGYNVLGEPALAKRLLGNRNLIDRLSWTISHRRRGPNGVRRRVTGEELFGKVRVSTAAQMGAVIFLERACIEQFEDQEISAEELLRRINLIMPSEIGPLAATADVLRLAGCGNLLPTTHQFQEGMSSVLLPVLRNTTLRLLRIPENAGPAPLVDAVRRLLASMGL